jgi:hypothetical protein
MNSRPTLAFWATNKKIWRRRNLYKEREKWYNKITMTESEIQQNVNQIEAIYADFQRQLQKLKAEQDAIISNFLKKLETAKLEELRNIIANK